MYLSEKRVVPILRKEYDEWIACITQEEKRVTKENIIILKQFFNHQNDERHSKMISELLDILD